METKCRMPWLAKHVGEAITKAQDEMGISTVQLAKNTGVSRVTITKAKSGSQSLNIENAYKICVEPGIPLSALVPEIKKKRRRRLHKPPVGRVQEKTGQIIKMRKQGATVKNIANELKVSEGSIYRILKQIRADAQ